MDQFNQHHGRHHVSTVSDPNAQPSPPPEAMSREELREYIREQILEIERYKWCMGEKLGHDPLADHTLDEIALEWIRGHGADFREWYIARQRRAGWCGNEPVAQ